MAVVVSTVSVRGPGLIWQGSLVGWEVGWLQNFKLKMLLPSSGHSWENHSLVRCLGSP